MALPKIDKIEIDILNNWFTDVVDTMTYNLGQIESAVPTLDKVLTNLDTVPIQYLKKSLNELVENINDGFEQIDQRLRMLESKNRPGG